MKLLMTAALACLSLCPAAFAAETPAPAQKQESPDSRHELADQIAELEKTDAKVPFTARLSDLEVEKQKAQRNGDESRVKIIQEEIASLKGAVEAAGQKLKVEDGKKKQAVDTAAQAKPAPKVAAA